MNSYSWNKNIYNKLWQKRQGKRLSEIQNIFVQAQTKVVILARNIG
jgi:hypothetical protein